MPKIAEIEATPNPNARRFTLREPLSRGVTRAFESAESAMGDPLASALFAVPHVVSVFYVDTYLTVTQDGAVPWAALERQLAPPIRSAPAAGAEKPPDPEEAEWVTRLSGADRARLTTISHVLDVTVRPALLADGGGLEVLGLVGSRLMVRYQGACGTCPSSFTATLMGIENVLRSIEQDLELVLI
jgi:Fe-S cluster biogenesis protein NfuA